MEHERFLYVARYSSKSIVFLIVYNDERYNTVIIQICY